MTKSSSFAFPFSTLYFSLMRKIILLLLVASTANFASADVGLPKIFGDNMVLQRDHPVMIWGWASPKEKVMVLFNSQSKTVTTGKDGKWKLSLDPQGAGGPYELIVKGKKNTISYKNVLVGDVWICSGQSNMEFDVKNTNHAELEIADANYPKIRHIKVPNEVASKPMTDIIEGVWNICSPETVGNFTAVGYFFARELTKQLNVPIGLINTSWGGTNVETWTSRDAFENSDEFRSMIASMRTLNLDSLAKANAAKAVKRIQDLQGTYPESKQIVEQWKAPAFDDASWPQMTVPGLWENQALGDVDGVVWLRKRIIVTPAEAGKEAALELGMIDDNDETFLNGEKIGEVKGYTTQRRYAIPAGKLKEGANVIAVRVSDTAGGGGIYGEPENVNLVIGDKTLPLSGPWFYRVEWLSGNASTIDPNQYPSLLYNAMIHPLIPFTIQGAIWYQGESNAGRAFQYRKAFPLMISDWRKKWGQGDFPFYFVQLASYNSDGGNSKNGSAWAELREAQTLTLSLPHTGMAVTTDIGNPDDIHPRNKQDVGKRLAALALRDVHKKNIVANGPVYKSMAREGNKLILTFDNTGKGLVARDKYGYLKGFEVAGSDHKFHYAMAHIDGDKVVVYQDSVADPVAVRFGWADDASDDNLFNREGFPAAPFRTDDWTGVTEKSRYTTGF
jgi:sialate O-acetylesterase